MIKRNRVVITGIGAVTPIGTGRREFWEGVRASRRGVGPVTRFDASGLRTRIAGETEVRPGDEVAFGRKHRFTVQYTLSADAQHELEALVTEDENIFGRSLLEKAGLASVDPPKPRRPQPPKPRPWGRSPSTDPTTLDD